MTEDEMIAEYQKGLCQHGNYHCNECEKIFKEVAERELECPICIQPVIFNQMDELAKHMIEAHPDGGNG